jgi:hypothetical protein
MPVDQQNIVKTIFATGNDNNNLLLSVNYFL